MKNNFLTIIFIILTYSFLGTVISAETEDHVIVLTNENFDEEITKHENILVEFYAPWCGHCKQLAPEYSKAAAVLIKDSPPLYLAKVDATKNKELAGRFKLDGYPTIKLFTKGVDSVEYEGGRTAQEIVSWYRKKVNPISRQFSTVKEVEAFANANKVVVIFFGKQDDKFQTFLKVAGVMEDVFFGHCESEECKAQYEITTDNQVIMLKQFDERINKLETFSGENSLKQFIQEHSVPLVTGFDEKAAESIFAGNKYAFFFLRPGSNTKYDKIIATLAVENKGKMLFVACDIKEDFETRLASFLGVTETDLPHIRILNATTEAAPTYAYTGSEITEKGLREFIKQFWEGGLQQYYKSEATPATQDGPVFKLVRHNFEKEVYESGRNVLVFFYAPWCEHCQKLEPKYKKIAEAFNEIPDLLISKLDATANDIDGINIEGFPSIKLFMAKEQSAIDLVDEPGTETITRFLNENLNLNVTVSIDPDEVKVNPQDYHYDL
jgi:protein disulfide-isomerase A1